MQNLPQDPLLDVSLEEDVFQYETRANQSVFYRNHWYTTTVKIEFLKTTAIIAQEEVEVVPYSPCSWIAEEAE